MKDLIHEIEAPPTSITIKYPNVNILDVDSCSSCLSTIFLFLKNNKKLVDDNFTAEHPLTLVIGRGVTKEDLYELDPIFLVGNCTLNNKGCCGSSFISGCAPVQSQIRKEVEEYIQKT